MNKILTTALILFGTSLVYAQSDGCNSNNPLQYKSAGPDDKEQQIGNLVEFWNLFKLLCNQYNSADANHHYIEEPRLALGNGNQEECTVDNVSSTESITTMMPSSASASLDENYVNKSSEQNLQNQIMEDVSFEDEKSNNEDYYVHYDSDKQQGNGTTQMTTSSDSRSDVQFSTIPHLTTSQPPTTPDFTTENLESKLGTTSVDQFEQQTHNNSIQQATTTSTSIVPTVDELTDYATTGKSIVPTVDELTDYATTGKSIVPTVGKLIDCATTGKSNVPTVGQLFDYAIELLKIIKMVHQQKNTNKS